MAKDDVFLKELNNREFAAVKAGVKLLLESLAGTVDRSREVHNILKVEENEGGDYSSLEIEKLFKRLKRNVWRD